MTDNDHPDPQRRPAVEHLGFADDALGPGATGYSAPVLPVPGSGPLRAAAPRSRRPAALIAAGALSVTLMAGLGGAALVASGDSGGDSAGGTTDRGSSVVQVDDDGHDRSGEAAGEDD